jgi:hypothetical protein
MTVAIRSKILESTRSSMPGLPDMGADALQPGRPAAQLAFVETAS